MKKLESAQRGALPLISRTKKSTPTNAIEAELSATPTDLHHQELQKHEAIKIRTDPVSYFNYKNEQNNQKHL